MKYLIIGGEGFVGSHLVNAFPDNICIDDRSFNKIKFKHTRVKSILDNLDDEVREADFVIHAACRDLSTSVIYPVEDSLVNVTGMVNLISTCRKFNKPFLYLSSVSIYSEASHYAISKLCGEYYTKFYRKWIPTYIVRLSNVYGKGDAASVFGLWYKQDKITLIDPDHTRDFTFVGDVIEGIKRVLEAKPIDAIDIGTGVETRLGDLADWFASRIGKPIEIVSKREVDNIEKRVVYNIEKTEKLIGFRAASSLFEELDKCIDDYLWKSEIEYSILDEQ